VWTDWKNVLLWELYEKVHIEFLGLEEASAQEEERLAQIRREVQQRLMEINEPGLGERPQSFEEASKWTEEHLRLLPHRHPLGANPELTARQILLARRAAQGRPAVAFFPVVDEGYTVLLLCCPDTHGLFARMAGTLASLEVNILRVRLDTRKDGIAVDIFWISTTRGDVIDDPARLRRIGNTMEGVLTGRISFEDVVAKIDGRPLAPAHKNPQISLNNDISEHCTVLEVLAEDRLGLAYSMAHCLTELGLDIVFAKLATEKMMAFDVFYLKESGGGKIPTRRWPQLLGRLQEVLRI
jgi:[protein-PII] uridylyltransferase